MISVLNETLIELQGQPANLSDPIETGGRLIHHLSKRSNNSKLLKALLRFIKIGRYLDKEGVNFLDKIENDIAAMDDEALAFIENEIAQCSYCDAYLHYWSGLALHARRRLDEALNRYLVAIERHNWYGGLRWSIALKAAEITYQAGNIELGNTLDKIVIAAKQPGPELKRLVMRRMRQTNPALVETVSSLSGN